jgi:hypothetical protein
MLLDEAPIEVHEAHQHLHVLPGCGCRPILTLNSHFSALQYGPTHEGSPKFCARDPRAALDPSNKCGYHRGRLPTPPYTAAGSRPYKPGTLPVH